ncbi:MAG: hypothetical protein JRI59_08975, partial [Deltaproteobacteria bacterium]|nr:hypothetical protein [Deltaproteobacteria bacterium]
ALALKLLQQTLDELRHSLLTLHQDLARAREARRRSEAESPAGQAKRLPNGSYLH